MKIKLTELKAFWKDDPIVFLLLAFGIISILYWLPNAITAPYIIYRDLTTIPTHTVFACPLGRETSKCYNVPARITPRDENIFFIEKIYFPDGGYIEFQDCAVVGKDFSSGQKTDWCYDEESDWELTMDKKEYVKNDVLKSRLIGTPYEKYYLQDLLEE